MENGLILKILGGFYYVKIGNNEIYTCRARGNFRQKKLTPLVGDYVTIRIVDTEIKEGYVEEILERKNSLIRPAMANLDRLIIVSAIADPLPDTMFIDKLIAICEFNNIEPIICFNKLDLSTNEQIISDYKKIGYKVLRTSTINGDGINEFRTLMKDGITAVAGFSGVGKSSLLNTIDKAFLLKTGVISDKIARGKHTTRHVELLCLSDTAYLADTPGFSNLDIDEIRATDLSDFFIEFNQFSDNCKFRGCTHTKEIGCSVKEACLNGEIPEFRLKNYNYFYDKLIKIKDWERDK